MKNLLTTLILFSFSFSLLKAADNWIKKSPNPKPTTLYDQAMAYIGDDKVLMFGGDSGSSTQESWIYDLSDNKWMKIKNGISPRRDVNHAMANIGNGKVLLFTSYRETWVFDTTGYRWTKMSPDSMPSRRHSHAMATIDSDRVALVGGFINDTPHYSRETWVYDLSDDQWTLMDPLGWPPSPFARYDHAMANIGGDRIVLFGGYNSGYDDTCWADTWIYDLSDNKWINKKPSGDIPGIRRHTLTKLSDDKVLLFGGSRKGGGRDSRTWVYDLSDNKWTAKKPTSYPTPRSAHGAAEIGKGLVLLYGGINRGFFDDTWVWRSELKSQNLLRFNRSGIFSIKCYPNPSNPAKNVYFTFAGFSNTANYRIRIDIFNERGQCVKTINKNGISSGSHLIRWNGSNYSGIKVGSGIYLSRFFINDQFQSEQRMTFIR